MEKATITKTLNNEALRPRQAKLVSLFVENLEMNQGKRTKTFRELLTEAGYSATTATVPHLVFKSKAMQTAIKEALEPYQNELDGIIENVIETLKKRDLSKEKTSILAKIYAELKRYSLLDEGKATENVAHQIKVVNYKD